jgi:hypothetical protein
MPPKPKRKRGATQSQWFNQGFKQTKQAMTYLEKKIALTDEVYAQKDRVEGIIGYHYVYNFVDTIEKQKDFKLDVIFNNKRIKADSSPKAVFEPYSDDPSNPDAEEHLTIDLDTFLAARD